MKSEKIITAFYREQIEILGGILLVHPGKIQEELIWILSKNLHQNYLDTLEAFAVMAKIEKENEKVKSSATDAKPHPAILHILDELDRTQS